MLRLRDLKLPLDHPPEGLAEAIVKKLRIHSSELISYKLVKRSIDARFKDKIMLVYSVDVLVKKEEILIHHFAGDSKISKTPNTSYRYRFKAPNGFPKNKHQRPVVVGAGPCGYFAALTLAQMGFRPLLIERGKAIKERTLETFGFWKGNHAFNPDSNVQFGEGGAGTFSDGKLYSQKSDPEHYGRKVLEELVASGANSDILTTHRPHIGTFKLASVVRGMRSRIEEFGGEIRFETRMERLLLERRTASHLEDKLFQVLGLKLADGSIINTQNVILALGHSARDTFESLESVGVKIEQKLFSVGFRIEHKQSLIDRDRWGGMVGHPQLGHAEYKLVHHASNGRCVYSFCMCPGGLVVGATSEKDCVVTNGMSQHTRNERNANSALVVNLFQEDLLRFERWPLDPLAGISFQRSLEKKAFDLGGSNYSAPSQRLADFMAYKPSVALGRVKPSYLPGIKLTDLNYLLPNQFIDAIREALPVFGKRLSSFNDPDALLTGIETRTSSPIRIPRDSDLESVNTGGLIPAGEGAGYAGGILSAGIDGIRAAEALAKILVKR